MGSIIFEKNGMLDSTLSMWYLVAMRTSHILNSVVTYENAKLNIGTN